MTKLGFAILYAWTALAFAAASKSQTGKFHGEWIKLAFRVAQQPHADVANVLLAFDPAGHWPHMLTIWVA